MPSWFVPLVCLVALVGFIWFAFRQGAKATPDRNNTNTGQARMAIRPALSENPESDPGALAVVAFRSGAAVAGWPVAPPVYPQLRKYPHVPATYVSGQEATGAT
jgi:hypothetical protein